MEGFTLPQYLQHIEDDDLLKVKEIAELEDKTRWTIYRWIDDGYLPTVNTRGHFRISGKDYKDVAAMEAWNKAQVSKRYANHPFYQKKRVQEE